MAVEEAVVVALTGRGSTLLEDFGGGRADWGGVGANYRRQGDEEGGEGDHVGVEGVWLKECWLMEMFDRERVDLILYHIMSESYPEPYPVALWIIMAFPVR